MQCHLQAPHALMHSRPGPGHVRGGGGGRGFDHTHIVNDPAAKPCHAMRAALEQPWGQAAARVRPLHGSGRLHAWTRVPCKAFAASGRQPPFLCRGPNVINPRREVAEKRKGASPGSSASSRSSFNHPMVCKGVFKYPNLASAGSSKQTMPAHERGLTARLDHQTVCSGKPARPVTIATTGALPGLCSGSGYSVHAMALPHA